MAPWLLAGLTVFLSAFHSALAAQITYVGSVSSLEPVCPVKPIFDSLKNWIVDIQGVTKDQNGLGTTFSSPVVL